MNEVQHEARQRLREARRVSRLRRNEYLASLSERRNAEKALEDAIARDRASWYATPGINPDDPETLRGLGTQP